MPDDFHDARFPPNISLGSRGGPERKTTVVGLASGKEQRNQQWQASRRRYDAGYGIKKIEDLDAVIAFFEERRGRLTAFRWKDWADYKSCDPSRDPSAVDQALGTGDGTQTLFQLVKVYGSGFNPYSRAITKPVAGTVLIALDGIAQGSGFSLDLLTGAVSFEVAPAPGVAVTAGYEFDVPARFDTDFLDVHLNNHRLGSVPAIPIVEVVS